MPKTTLPAPVKVVKVAKIPYVYEYISLLKTVDGDTFDISIDLGAGVLLKKVRVRLLGCDCPERANVVSQIAGNAALFFSDSWLRKYAPNVRFLSHMWEASDADCYGRFLGDFQNRATGELLSEWLMKNGIAKSANKRTPWDAASLAAVQNFKLPW